MTKDDWVSPIVSYDPFLMWPLDVTWQIKNFVPPLPQNYDHQTFKDQSLGWAFLSYQVILTFNHKVTCQVKNSKKDQIFIPNDSRTITLGWEETYSETL